MSDAASFLDYGAVGLLALVLVAIAFGAREFLKRWQEGQAAREQREATRMDEKDALVAQVVADATKERRDTVAQLQALVAQDVEAKTAVGAALNSMCAEMAASAKRQGNMVDLMRDIADGLRQHEERSAARHASLMDQQREVVTTLKALNGK